ncbi:hypothetical protein [Acidithiobacillus caldus]|uniref:hypothetical protein n=1 Tax=Acidithiobacillus caldus TaxID=33059 RepID=UPI0007D95A66|nr:hypothetical protein [Acidithiobacillus caldus]QER45554.1 hypothetical protein F0726_02500 [Acidithiobacillus caldus]
MDSSSRYIVLALALALIASAGSCEAASASGVSQIDSPSFLSGKALSDASLAHIAGRGETVAQARAVSTPGVVLWDELGTKKSGSLVIDSGLGNEQGDSVSVGR